MTTSSREQICRSTADILRKAAPGLASISAVLGFDGFVDEIITVVDKRHDVDHYEPVESIASMARKILGASGESSNYELIVNRQKLGGNGPIMANALATLGIDVTYIGNLGYPEIHPVFRDFAAKSHVISIADPGHTDALEFADGKLMLGKLQSLADVNWPNLVDRVGEEKLAQLIGGATLIGMVNWTMLPRMNEIWLKLIDDVFPKIPRAGRTLYIDLADPEKRTREDLRVALATVTCFQLHVDVILGMNLKEATQVADVLGLPDRANREDSIEEDAAAIRQALRVSCVVIHPRKAAAAATEQGSARFAGPFVQFPKISTGAGDHFNSGFCLARILGLSLEQSLCAGVATSGYYVRSAQSPSINDLAGFIDELPSPEG
jgi:sugar/nucleoside kinase (ribokinase family)